MLDNNYTFFESNFDELYKKYPNKFVVIKSCSVIGVYDSFNAAYNETIKNEEIGTFLIQECSNNDNIVNQFHFNNVTFA